MFCSWYSWWVYMRCLRSSPAQNRQFERASFRFWFICCVTPRVQLPQLWWEVAEARAKMLEEQTSPVSEKYLFFCLSVHLCLCSSLFLWKYLYLNVYLWTALDICVHMYVRVYICNAQMQKFLMERTSPVSDNQDLSLCHGAPPKLPTSFDICILLNYKASEHMWRSQTITM